MPASSYTAEELVKACSDGRLDKVQEILACSSSNINIESKNSQNMSSLYASCWKGHFEVAKLLIVDHSADIETLGYSECSSLYACTHEGHLSIVELLLKRGATVDAGCFSRSYCTPLYAACSKLHIPIVKMLIAAGADIEAQAYDGSTALHHACHKSTELAIWLVEECGANIKVLNNNNNDPLIYLKTDLEKETIRIAAQNYIKGKMVPAVLAFVPAIRRHGRDCSASRLNLYVNAAILKYILPKHYYANAVRDVESAVFKSQRFVSKISKDVNNETGECGVVGAVMSVPDNFNTVTERDDIA